MTRFTLKHALVISSIMFAASMPAWWANNTGTAMLALLPKVNLASAYLNLIQPTLQYLIFPVVLLGTIVLVMAPGLLLVAALGRATEFYRWIIEGFIVSLVVISLTTAFIQHLIGHPLVGHAFFLTVQSLTLIGALTLITQVQRGNIPDWTPSNFNIKDTLVLLGVPVLFAVILTPKFFWESFNGDGAHAYESVRLLLFQAWPFWPDTAGAMRAWPGINSLTLAYPLSWFMRLFGTSEAGVRLPFVLFLSLLYAALHVVINTNRQQRIKPVEALFIWTAVLGYALVMSYSATYNPYSSDIALPATQDTLLIIFFLGAFGAWLSKEPGLLLVWTLLALMTSPGGMMIFAAALAGILVSQRPRRWRLITQYGLALAGCLIILKLLPHLLSLFGVATPGGEHGVKQLLYKFAFIATADFERFLYAFLPIGLYPVLGLLSWQKADEPTRVLTAITVLVFALYYFIGTSSLHYFVPAMILPIAVFWRRFSSDHLGAAGLSICGLAATASLWLALPASSGIYTATRDVGMRIDVRTFSSYHEMDPIALSASDRLTSLFPTDGAIGVPDERYGDSPIAWNYYAQQLDATKIPKAYVLSTADAKAPADALEVTRDKNTAVYIKNKKQWEQDKILQPVHSRGKLIYQIDRNVLFPRGKALERFGFIRLKKWVYDLLGREH